MDSFPLTPFLMSLSGKGFVLTIDDYRRIGVVLKTEEQWTLARLRGVLIALLARDENQEQILCQQFNQFFDLNLTAESKYSDINLAQALDDLARLSRQDGPTLARPNKPYRRQTFDSSQPFRHRPHGKWISQKTRWIVLSVALLGSLGMLFIQLRPWFNAQRNQDQQTINLPQPTSTNSPNVGLILPAALTLTTIMVIGLLIVRSTRARSLQWNPDGPRHFPLGHIGGKPTSRLDRAVIDLLADSMGIFRAEEEGKTLDVLESIDATLSKSGIPTLVFKKQTHMRAVIILEDARSELLMLNRTAAELANGLTQRGIPVLFGKFYGSPSAFLASDGIVHDFEDLERDRAGYLVLIFSDGKSLRSSDTFTLESLARWPMIAWMELREPALWDESSARIALCRIPIYPATSDGLIRVSNQLLKEQGQQKLPTLNPRDWRGAPPSVGGDTQSYLESFLGDSLRWAQSCSIMQPVSLGLADCLRRQFHPGLPPERIDRMFLLHGTSLGPSGLRFSKPILKALRLGFGIRWSRSEQEAIVSYIMEKIRQTEPEEIDSIAHIAWESTLERVRLNVEPTGAMNRLKELAESPLGDSIREELEQSVRPVSEQSVKPVSDPSVWEIEKTYRLARDLFKQGRHDAALDLIDYAQRHYQYASSFIELEFKIRNAMDVSNSSAGVTFRETKRALPGVLPAAVKSTVRAEYPQKAKDNYISGEVNVEVEITRYGDVSIARSVTGPPLLRYAAAEAASNFKFYPAKRGEWPVEYSETIIFKFDLT